MAAIASAGNTKIRKVPLTMMIDYRMRPDPRAGALSLQKKPGAACG
jgi:hypothetical protein